MAKQITHGDDSRQKVMRRINRLSDAVKDTPGPKGRNVVLDKKSGAPLITKDGVTVAKEIELEEPLENMGAQMLKEVASKTSAGDGTTIATVLAQTIRSLRGNAIDGAAYEGLLAELTAAPGVARLADSPTGGDLTARRNWAMRLRGNGHVQPTRAKFAQPRTDGRRERVATAVVYCEAHFGAIDGKTANGLVRHSEKYEIVSVIDSEKAGLDAGMVLGDEPNAIPVCRDLTEALALAGSVPEYFIFGMAPASGMLSTNERGLVLRAMDLGMNVVNGLHEFLNDDPEFAAMSEARNVEILDVRKPRPKKDLRIFSGRIAQVTCPRIAVLGTDCAIGKRTTATILVRALNDRGMNAVLVGTGQTGLIQGARYGVALDAIPSQFCPGELEATIVEAFEGENPDVIVIEGQGALSHPAFSTSSLILRGSHPDGVVLQHAPGRLHRCDFEQMAMPTPTTEVNLIQTFADTKVIGLTINHENMTDAEVDAAITLYESELGIPVTDALTRSPELLVEMVLSAFPELEEKQTAGAR